jgi:cell wall-associated NlpC family hydrolase
MIVTDQPKSTVAAVSDTMTTSDNAVAARPDRRRSPWRDDIAAESIRADVDVPRYVTGSERQVTRSVAPVRRKPELISGLETEVLFGERVTVYEEAEGWAWVQLARDRYVGYIRSDALSRELTTPTHHVKAIGTFVYSEANIKSPPLMHLSLNSEISVIEEKDAFAEIVGGGYIVTRHLAERGQHARDFIDIAARLLGTPYLWGGRTRVGVDCSGLIQIAMEAAGLQCPRDSDMQQAELGEPVTIDTKLENLKRGDLVFWKGHVGVMSDGMMLMHANAHHMSTVIEPLTEAVMRINKSGDALTAIKRLERFGA